MPESVKMQLLFRRDGKQPGDTIEVSPAEAKRLQSANLAVPATVPEAKKAGLAPEVAATKRD